MNKRRAAVSPDQLGFTFDAPQPARREGDLAGLPRLVAGIVGQVLKEDARSRDEIAGAMTALIGEEISRFALDAWASEAREQHNVSAARLLALIAVTSRYDLLDVLLRRIGAALLIGDEMHAARLGHLQAEANRINAQLRQARQAAQPITRGLAS